MKTFKVFAAAFFCSAALLCAEAGPTKKTGEFTKSNDGEWTTKVSVKRGEEYTFWVVPGTEDCMCSLNVEGEYKYKEDGETYEEWIWASGMASKEDGTEYVLLDAEDWDSVPSSISSVSFTVTVSGFWDEEVKANNKFTLYYEKGRSSFPGDDWGDEPENDPLGSETNPRKISFKESISKDKCAPDEESEGYFIETSAKLAKGRKYLIGVEETGGLEIYADSDPQVNLAEEDETGTVKPYYGWEDCIEAYSITPGDSTAVKFRFQMPAGEPFKLWYQVMPALSPEKHDFTPIAVGETSEPFNPGYMCDPAGAGWDDVIDQELFAVTDCVAGRSYAFETSGADAALIMRVYDKSGNILAENFRTSGEEGAASDLRCVWTAPAKYSPKNNYIYVGVCQKLESEDEEPYAGEVELTVREVAPVFPQESLSPVPDAAAESPVLCPDAEASSDAVLSDSIWTNTYAIAARAGVTYRVKAAAGAQDLRLGARVYTLSGGKAALLGTKEKLSGSIDPADDGWLEFTPSAHGTVYIDTFVAAGSWGTGCGLDFGPYQVYATAAGAGMGILKVDMKGAPFELMGWQILKKDGKAPSPKEPFYPAGASAIVPAGSYTIGAQTVKDFATPPKDGFATVAVTAGTSPAEPVPEYKYTDSADPLDDSPDSKAVEPSTKKKYSPAKLSPSSGKPAVAARSLWEGDTDWFTFSATAGSFYRFTFAEKTGDAAMAVYGPDGWTQECTYDIFENPESSLRICAAEKGTYYVKVFHGGDGGDSTYTLEAATANPGVVKFAKTAIAAKDSAPYVDVSVSRTGKDGAVRVKYRTLGAQTGVSDAYYYPTNGVLEWAEGDTKAKTVRVRLVPQDSWSPDRVVKVVLGKITPEDEEYGFDPETEYTATFETDKRTGETLDTATITVSSTAKQSAGTIQAVCSAPKKPVFTVAAGETVEIPFERASGSSGIVGVSLATVKGTANKSGETDFTPVEETFVWEDGETGVKTLTVDTKTAADDWTAVKTFTVKVAALASRKGDAVQYAKPSIAGSSVTVNIVNEKFTTTMADHAKAVAASSCGYTLKEGKSGTWVVTPEGDFYAPKKGDLTFTFSTTGVFTYTVDGGDEQVFEATAKSKTLTEKGASSFSIVGYVPDGTPVTLRQCVAYTENFGSEGTFKAANLPAGLKLAQDKTTKEWILSGVPSKPGLYQTVYTKTVGKTAETETYCYTVEAAGASIGTFTGLAQTYDTEDRLPQMASVTFTATAAGKLSAKAQIAGKTYTFSADGYSAAYGTPGDEYDPPVMEAELVSVQKVGSGKTASNVTNTMFLTVCDLPEDHEAQWSAQAEVEIRMAVLPDASGSGYQEDVWYEGSVCRDNSKVAAWQEAAAGFAGYYTIALVSPDAAQGEPRGSGYVTLALAENGKAKISGMFPDGTKYSASSVAAAFADGGEEAILMFPLYACTPKQSFAAGGWIALKAQEGGKPVATMDTFDTVLVVCDNPASTWDGEDGYSLELNPAGGWYDTVGNLQRAYLEKSLAAELVDGEEALEELSQTLPDGYAFAAEPSGEALTLAGNALSAEKQALAKDASKLNVWESCVNAANLKPSFKRATGELSGTFDLWYEGVNAKGAKEQKTLSGLKFYSVLLMNFEDNGLLDGDVWATGFYIVPVSFSEKSGSKTVTRKYNASYRFDVKAAYAPVEWADAE